MPLDFLKLLNLSCVWEIKAPFDTSHPEKMNVVKVEGVDLLPPYNKYRDIHSTLIEAYKLAVKPGIMLSVTCSLPDELSKWDRELEFGIMQVIMAAEKAKMMMKSDYKAAVLSDFTSAYEDLYREVASYYDSKEFHASTKRAWKELHREYEYDEGDYPRLLANWAEKFEFACIMKNRKYRKIEKKLETLKEIVMSDEFHDIFVY